MRKRVYRIKLNAESMKALKRQLENFKKKFGRDPGPNDPVFFDPDFDTPVPISKEKSDKMLKEAARKAGLDPELVLKHFP